MKSENHFVPFLLFIFCILCGMTELAIAQTEPKSKNAAYYFEKGEEAISNKSYKTALAHFNVVGFVEDFGNNMMKELDYTNEASNMKRFAAMFKDDETVYIPQVASQYTSQRLLIMEYVTGMRPDNPQALREAGFNTQQIAENGTHIILKMILKHGFFHADPHPGNIFIRGDNQIVLIDHGMAATLKPKQIQALIDFMLGFAQKDSRKLTKAILHLCDINYFNQCLGISI